MKESVRTGFGFYLLMVITLNDLILMSKEEAREILENFLIRQDIYSLPVYERVIRRYNYESREIEEYSFRHLLCVAYDLTEKNTNE